MATVFAAIIRILYFLVSAAQLPSRSPLYNAKTIEKIDEITRDKHRSGALALKFQQFRRVWLTTLA